MAYRVNGLATGLRAVQILYRSTNGRGQPTANVTSVILPPVHTAATRVVSYQSAYDSLDPADSPSRSIAESRDTGTLSAESVGFAPLLAAGVTVVVPDTEGPTADFAAGPEYGMATLDSLRAVSKVAATGIRADTPSALIGYSGGAIATGWAAILGASYAPEVNKHIVGVSEGGVLVDPAHNLRYASGSKQWAGVVAMAVVGIARSFGIDFSPYLNAVGARITDEMKDDIISDVLGHYPGLTWRQMVKPQYADPNSVPEFVDAVNRINMGTAAAPTIPMQIVQATNGIAEGTPVGGKGIGAGDGIMVAGDVRALARQYCATGLPVQYTQYDQLSHTTGAAAWGAGMFGWIADRFAGTPAPQNCASIAPGNSLAPEKPVAPAHRG
ncbi:lipase family protein [Gordonia jinhuaensis]|uniref:lipase family protein n=1 Tax=Gordonia jinhuaensis TaxID=1517702 RepID=UPI001E5DC3C3|nr:lipase family protein [Gordonia jinhuaensis]